METEKSIVFKIDRELWAKFKSKIAHEDRRIGGLVRQWIKNYVEPKKEIVPRPKRRTLETASLPTEELIEYAERFNIPTEGKNEQALGGEVMDKIQSAYDYHKGDNAWISENVAMLEFFNSNRGRYPADED